MLNSKFNQGFTLVEVLISMAIISIGAIGAFLAIQNGVAQTTFSSSRSTAAYLAQEGIEIVRNIRDTNYLRDRYKYPGEAQIPWDDGIPAGNCLEVDYQSKKLLTCGRDSEGKLGRYLNIDQDGFYSYFLGKKTPFKRKIEIQKTDNSQIKIMVTVEWEERGKSYNFVLQGNIYNVRSF